MDSITYLLIRPLAVVSVLAFIIVLILLATRRSLVFSAEKSEEHRPASEGVPRWAQEAIWYQVFVERFRNGDATNDPTPSDMAGAFPEPVPAGWSVTPWGHDWYRAEAWQEQAPVDGFYPRVQLRRFGGDLQGVLDQLDYIEALGVNALYFNPLNDAPSLHKYDARHYHPVDRNFGPDPRADALIMEKEDHGDPSAWQWTSADRLFLKLVAECHRRGIKVVMDYSWNHTGLQFWALRDIRKRGPSSPYSDWFNIEAWEDPAKPEDECRFEGWSGVSFMPVAKKIIDDTDGEMPFEGNFYAEGFKDHIYAVTRRWLDPDGDGDPSDGVDGFRLDVAGEVPMGFWRDYRRFVRSINPEAYLVGEIWWQEWPHRLMDPRPFLQGDQFDAIMNYRWYRLARGFFGQAAPVLKPTEFVAGIQEINRGIGIENLRAMMNVAASHDSPRLSTSLFNKNLYKYNAKPTDDPEYKIHRPDERTRREQKMLLLHQFTFLGSPHIWNGDEVGMWGADDPDCRKPMVWDDLAYEDETAHLIPGRERPPDKVFPDRQLLEHSRSLTRLRRENPVLVYGSLNFLLADDERMLLVYSRAQGDRLALVLFNRSEDRQELSVPAADGQYRNGLLPDEKPKSSNGLLTVELLPLEGKVFFREEI